MLENLNRRERHFGRAACIVLLLAACLSTPSPAAAGEEAAEQLEIIRRVLGERGEYDIAEGQLRKFVDDYRTRPAAAEALVLLGYCLDKQKKNNEAAAAYSRMLSEHPNAPAPLRADAALGAADAWFRLGRYEDAARYYTQVMESSQRPEQGEAALLWRGEANYRLGMAALDAGRPGGEYLTSSAADFASFIERYPESKSLPSAVAGAAFSCFDAGDYLRALYYLERFARDFPDDKRYEECRFYAGEALYRLKRYDEAKVMYGELVERKPSGQFAAEARAGMAWADYGLRRIAEAAAGFEAAAGMAEDDRDRALSFLYDAGCAWREAGDVQKAGEAFQEVAKAGDHELNRLAWFRLGTLWQEQARAARERAAAATGPVEKKRFADMQKSMGEDAIKYFRQALAGDRLGDEEVEARSLLGEVLLDAGRNDEAAVVFDEIAARWPRSERAPWALYHAALARRELSLAARDGAAARDSLRLAATALEKSLEYPEAKTRLQATWALADYLSSLGDAEGSRERYRWLSAEAVDWAGNWKAPGGGNDPALIARARELASDSLFRLGESYYFASDYPRASTYYEELTQRHAGSPQAAMAELRLGEIAENGRDAAAALVRYEEALKQGLRLGKNRVGSTIGYAQLRLGTLLLREGQRERDEARRRRQIQEALRNLTAVVTDPPEGLNLGRPYYYLAEAKYSLGLKKEAVSDYEASIARDGAGELADAAWFGLAWARRDLNDAAGAMEACRKVVDDFPASPLRPDSMVLLASLKRSGGDAKGALDDFEAFLAEYPGHALSAKAELERASAMDELGGHAEAAEAFQAFLSKYPEHQDVPQALYQRSWALWNLIRPTAQKARDAETRLRDISGGRPLDDLPEADKVEALKAQDEARGLSAQVKSAEDEILSALSRLTERFPDYPVADAAWLRIGEILYDRGEYQQALAAYQKSLAQASARNSDIADKAQYRMAWSIQRLAEAAERASLREADRERVEAARKEMWDRRVEAIDAFESIIGKYPRSELIGDASFRAAELRRRSGQDNADPAKRSSWFQTAVTRYRQALEKGGQDAPYRRAAEYGEALCLLSDDKNAEAREAFQKLLRRYTDGGPYVQEFYWGLGQANLKLGAYADASAAFEQALSFDKGTETAAKSRYGLGLTAALSGDRERARLEFLAVDALYSNYPEWAAAALVRAARTAMEDGLRDKALGDLERVLARYQNTPAAEEARELQAGITAGG